VRREKGDLITFDIDHYHYHDQRASQNSPEKGIFLWTALGYCCGMTDENPFEKDFLFTRVQKHNALQEQIRALDRFRNVMGDEDREAFDDLLQRADTHSSISYLAPRQTPFEHLLLTMMIEIHKETEKIKDEVKWKLMK
jgi:hypothetical protein